MNHEGHLRMGYGEIKWLSRCSGRSNGSATTRRYRRWYKRTLARLLRRQAQHATRWER